MVARIAAFFMGKCILLYGRYVKNFSLCGLVGIAGFGGLKLSPQAPADNVKALSNNKMYDYTK
jgi:hypothetical protein